ncbi:MAG TPA: glycosyltransferase family 4 protein [Allocoleopsis sp.]
MTGTYHLPDVLAVKPEVKATSLESATTKKARHAFVFLEIFACEGGIQSYVKDVLKSYAALVEPSGVEVAPYKADVFLLRDGPDCHNPLESSPIHFHYFKTRPPALGRIKLAAQLLAYLLRYRPERVFCGHINLAPLIQALCQPLGIPYTVLTYGKEFWVKLPNHEQKALQQAASIWTISRYSRDRACQVNGLDPQRVKLLPCIVDGDAFTPGPKNPALVEKYGLAGAKVLMTVARLWAGDRYKGVDVTIQALPAIAKVFPQVKYLVIGRGDDQPRLAQLAQDLGVADRVVFAGFVPTHDLVEHYRLADAYIMPSQEGFGIVYLEAMACGVPVVAGNADGSADPLQDGKLGWQVPRRDSEAVAAACIEILSNTQKAGEPSDRRCDGAWLRQEALSLFGAEALAQQLKQLLSSSSQS